MAEEIPVYLFTGFMDSGKTSLIKDTIFENDFANGSKGLIIMCEDGDVEYDMDKLKAANIQVAEIDSEDEFTAAKLNELNMQYLPEQVFIEYNGTWGIDKIIEAELPKGWVIVQSLATVDSTTFDLYMNNMRAMMQEQVFASDVVIFNRTDDDTDRGHLRRTIKNINRKAQIVYERKDGTIDERPEELPFDINKDVIELSDADYAIWYMDAMENYKKYDGKVVKFLALVYNPDKLRKGVMVPGRFAMTCCIEDVTFIGFKCKYEDESSIPHKSWITITARVHVEFAREYKGKGPVLYPVSIEPAEKPQKIALVSVAFIALATIICIFLSGAVRTQAAPSEISCKYYTSIEVQSGDTLWSIASDHITEEYRDMNAYIDEVCSINKISQNEIHAGQYLTIPYYSSIAIAGQ